MMDDMIPMNYSHYYGWRYYQRECRSTTNHTRFYLII